MRSSGGILIEWALSRMATSQVNLPGAITGVQLKRRRFALAKMKPAVGALKQLRISVGG